MKWTSQRDNDRLMSIRAQHRALTERTILDAVLALVAEGELGEVSVPAVEQRSGVSVATIHRYFRTKAMLLDAAAGVPSSYAATLRTERLTGGGFREYLVALWTGFAKNLPLLRHQATSTAGREMRALWLDAGRRQLAAELHDLGLDPESAPAKRLMLLYLLLGGSLASLELHDRQALSVDDAADEVAWAAQVLLAATRSEARTAARTATKSRRRGR
jgi:AcrR family transcriptional regulator